MPYSSGSFSLASGNPVVTGTTISSTWANNTLSDIATGLSTAMLKDGSQTLTANIPFGGFKLTGLGAGTAATDAAQLAQTQDGGSTALTAVSGTNTIVGTATPTPSAYATGQTFRFVPANTNTAATTINVSALGAKNIFWNNAALVGGEIRQNVPVEVYYDGTQFQLIGSGAMLNGYTVPSNVFRLQDNSDRTKQLAFALSGITTATTRTVTLPDADLTMVGTATTQTLTNKTFAVASNTLNMAQITNSLGANVSLNNTANYFDGPSIAQGTSGTWWASGVVTLLDSAGSASFDVKLWDGTTVIASGRVSTSGSSSYATCALSGYIASPAGNIRISAKDVNSTSGAIIFNVTGNSKDATVSAIRIA